MSEVIYYEARSATGDGESGNERRGHRKQDTLLILGVVGNFSSNELNIGKRTQKRMIRTLADNSNELHSMPDSYWTHTV